jgi:hypothetical protein
MREHFTYRTQLAQKMAAANAAAAGSGGAAPQDIGRCVKRVEESILIHIQSFCPPPGDPRIERLAQRATRSVDSLVAAWRIPREIAVDIACDAISDMVDIVPSFFIKQEGRINMKGPEFHMQRVASSADFFDEIE